MSRKKNSPKAFFGWLASLLVNNPCIVPSLKLINKERFGGIKHHMLNGEHVGLRTFHSFLLLLLDSDEHFESRKVTSSIIPLS